MYVQQTMNFFNFNLILHLILHLSIHTKCIFKKVNIAPQSLEMPEWSSFENLKIPIYALLGRARRTLSNSDCKFPYKKN